MSLAILGGVGRGITQSIDNQQKKEDHEMKQAMGKYQLDQLKSEAEQTELARKMSLPMEQIFGPMEDNKAFYDDILEASKVNGFDKHITKAPDGRLMMTGAGMEAVSKYFTFGTAVIDRNLKEADLKSKMLDQQVKNMETAFINASQQHEKYQEILSSGQNPNTGKKLSAEEIQELKIKIQQSEQAKTQTYNAARQYQEMLGKIKGTKEGIKPKVYGFDTKTGQRVFIDENSGQLFTHGPDGQPVQYNGDPNKIKPVQIESAEAQRTSVSTHVYPAKKHPYDEYKERMVAEGVPPNKIRSFENWSKWNATLSKDEKKSIYSTAD